MAPLTVGYLAAFTAFCVARGDRRIIAYLIVWSLLASLVRAAHRRWPVPTSTLGALSFAGALHLAGGLIPSPDRGAPILYETWIIPGVLKVDQAIHAAISAVVLVAVFQVLGHLLDPRRAGTGARIVLALLTCWGLGAANELFEFLSSLRFADAYVGDLSNAGWDLVFNAAGSVAAALWLGMTSLSGLGRHEGGGDRYPDVLVAQGCDAPAGLHRLLDPAEG